MRFALLLACALLPGAAFAQSPDKPLGLITAIYKTYQGGTGRPGPSHVYSRRLQHLLDLDAKATPKGEAGTIDWDVFVDGNDWELSGLRIDLVSQSPRHALVRANFKNFKRPTEILFDL